MASSERGRWVRGHGLAAFGVAAALVGFSGEAGAQPGAPAARSSAPSGETVGTVLAVSADEIVVDLGRDRGGSEGVTVELWRPLKLKHPVTGKVVTDRFRIGALRLGQVRPTLALATSSGQLTRDPQKGDVVILRSAVEVAPTPVPPSTPALGAAAPRVEPPSTLSPEAVEAKEVATIFDSLVGVDPSARIKTYEAYVRARPEGRYARVLQEEAASLKRLFVKGERGSSSQGPEVGSTALSFQGPSEAVENTPLRIGIELSNVSTGAVLHVRPTGRPSFASVPMTALGNGYFTVTVPAEKVVAPGIEYFIEGTVAGGAASAVVASADRPRGVQVHDAPGATPRGDLNTSVVILTDFADYNRLRGNDRVWQTEGYLGVRYRDVGVRALRSGFGVYRGLGGSIEELDRLENPRPGRKVGLTYGYLEAELGLAQAFAVVGRGAIGLGDDGITGGGQVFVRIGSDLGTNLLLGGELLGGVGLRTIAQIELNVFERVPITLRAETTNQPAWGLPSEDDTDAATGESERATRTIVQVGYRILPQLAVSVRGSVQGRTIEHAGPGVGGGLAFRW